MGIPDIRDLPIGGMQKQSLIDFPGRLAALVFTLGCNFRCIYCHNPGLVYRERYPSNTPGVKDVMDYLSRYRHMLDAVVITGGEPTLHHQLPAFIRGIKALGLELKLDTNGSNPEMLEKLIDQDLLDYVAMDVKAPLKLGTYRRIAGNTLTQLMLDKIRHSLSILSDNRVKVEFRCTVVDGYHGEEEINEISQQCPGTLYVQNFRSFPGNERPDLKPLGQMEALVDSLASSSPYPLICR